MISVEIEPLCRVECLNTDCEFHLETRGWFGCNLKRIMVSQKGKCLGYKRLTARILKEQ